MKNTKNNLKNIIINNPRAQERIIIKRIEREIADSNRNTTQEKRLEYSFFY